MPRTIRVTAGVALGMLLLFTSSAAMEASPQRSVTIIEATSYAQVDHLGCTGHFDFIPSSGTGSKWTTVEIEFDTGTGWEPAFTAKYLNNVEDGNGRLVPLAEPGTVIGFRARIARNNGAPLSEWATHSVVCSAP